MSISTRVTWVVVSAVAAVGVVISLFVALPFASKPVTDRQSSDSTRVDVNGDVRDYPNHSESIKTEPYSDVSPQPHDGSGNATGERAWQPHRLYAKYLERAEEGDTDAAYVLVTALQQCRFVVQSEEELVSDFVHAGKPEEVVNAARNNLAMCQGMFDLVADVSAEYDRWYKVIKEAQHPLFLVNQRNRSYEETRSLVISALSHQYPEPHLYRAAFLAASRLYKDYPEYVTDENRFLAWQLLACSVALECDYPVMRGMVVEQLAQVQAQEILDLESSLRESLESGDFLSLGI